VGSKTRKQVARHARYFDYQTKDHPNAEWADILPILQQKLITRWRDDEHTRFVNAVREHGKDFKKIYQAVATKTRKQV